MPREEVGVGRVEQSVPVQLLLLDRSLCDGPEEVVNETLCLAYLVLVRQISCFRGRLWPLQAFKTMRQILHILRVVGFSAHQ